MGESPQPGTEGPLIWGPEEMERSSNGDVAGNPLPGVRGTPLVGVLVVVVDLEAWK